MRTSSELPQCSVSNTVHHKRGSFRIFGFNKHHEQIARVVLRTNRNAQIPEIEGPPATKCRTRRSGVHQSVESDAGVPPSGMDDMHKLRNSHIMKSSRSFWLFQEFAELHKKGIAENPLSRSSCWILACSQGCRGSPSCVVLLVLTYLLLSPSCFWSKLAASLTILFFWSTRRILRCNCTGGA